jgi:hypothetical protein
MRSAETDFAMTMRCAMMVMPCMERYFAFRMVERTLDPSGVYSPKQTQALSRVSERRLIVVVRAWRVTHVPIRQSAISYKYRGGEIMGGERHT